MAKRYLHNDARLLPRYRRDDERRPEPLYSSADPAIAKAPGDPFGLRGIPLMSAQSAGGTMPGTQPEDALIASQPDDSLD